MARQLERPLAAGPRLKMTYEEWLDLPEDVMSEWVDGEVTFFIPPFTRHQDVAFFLAQLIARFVRVRRLGKVMIAPFEMRLESVPSSREPDILFISRERLDRISRKRLEGPADLVVEVVSTDSVARDRRDKWSEYAAVGIPEYWVVEGRDNQFGFKIWSLDAEGYYNEVQPDQQGLVWSSVLNGLSVDPMWLAEDELADPIELANEMVSRAAEPAD